MGVVRPTDSYPVFKTVLLILSCISEQGVILFYSIMRDKRDYLRPELNGYRVSS